MSIKITASFPKAVEFLNGLLPHAQNIAEAEFNAQEGECWSGVAVVHLTAASAARIAVSGELVPEVRISRIELMDGAREKLVTKLLEEVYRERTEAGTLMDPMVVTNDDEIPIRESRPGLFVVGDRDPHQARLRSTVDRSVREWSPSDELPDDDAS